MFDELIRELHRLERPQRLPIAIHTDTDDYLDRQCPSAECEFVFKVYNEDWRDKVRDEEVYCPFCGHTDTSGRWGTEEQVKHQRKTAIAHVRRRIGRAMKRDADDWNRRQPRNSLIRITRSVDIRHAPVPLPPAATDPMKLKITCSGCGCRYAVVGAAFFCPACRHNDAELMFKQTVNGIRRTLDALPVVRAAIPDPDTAEMSVRLITENGLQTAVTAFQRYVEALYSRLPSSPPARRNVFQNLKAGGELWCGATGKRYSDYITADDMDLLARYFQQRHLLAHTQGLVDADYLTQTADTRYEVGQRVVIRETAVRECLQLIEKLTDAMAGEVNPKGVTGWSG